MIALCSLQPLLWSRGEAECQTEVADIMEPTKSALIPIRMIITGYLHVQSNWNCLQHFAHRLSHTSKVLLDKVEYAKITFEHRNVHWSWSKTDYYHSLEIAWKLSTLPNIIVWVFAWVAVATVGTGFYILCAARLLDEEKFSASIAICRKWQLTFGISTPRPLVLLVRVLVR